jgi:hypothetical protein
MPQFHRKRLRNIKRTSATYAMDVAFNTKT